MFAELRRPPRHHGRCVGELNGVPDDPESTELWIVKWNQHLARGNLRIVESLGQGSHAAAGNAMRAQTVDERIDGVSGESPFEFGSQRWTVCDAIGIGSEPAVIEQ